MDSDNLKKWPDIENFSSIDKEKMLYIFEQTNACLKNTHEIRDRLENKSLAVVGGLVTLSTGLFGFIGTQIYKFDAKVTEQRWEVILPLIIIGALFFWATYRLTNENLCHKKYFPLGNEPQGILTQEQVDQQLKWIIYAEIANTQSRIEHNIEINNQRQQTLQEALFFAVFAPVAGIVLFIVIEILTLPQGG